MVNSARRLGDRHRCSASQIAIRWVLNVPNVSSVIVGAKTPQQIDDNVSALSSQLDDVRWDRLEVA